MVRRRAMGIGGAALACWAALVTLAAGQASSGVMNLLKSGKLPAERIGPVVELIARRGSPEELDYLLERAGSADGFTPAVRAQTLRALAESAQTRKVTPSGDGSALVPLLAPVQPAAVRAAALQLAAYWKAPALRAPLVALAEDGKTETGLRRAALEAVVAQGGADVAELLKKLTGAGQPAETRRLAVAAWARLDREAAAEQAAGILAGTGAEDDVGPVLEAFLDRRGGPEALAAALMAKPPTADAAKLVLRTVYALGRSDPTLVKALSDAAGLNSSPAPPSEAEVKALAAEAITSGDAVRGERVFRRGDLSCMKCHSVSGAGGVVGPDLSAVGSISPAEFLVNSVLQPDLAIKEQFVTRIVQTSEGQLVHGILVDRNDERIVLKDATGKEITVATADIDDEAEGPSLMPKGLVSLMTRAELLDLVKFLTELGKPGPWGIRTNPSLQRWRVLRSPPAETIEEAPNAELLRAAVLEAGDEAWENQYARVSGAFPLDELPARLGDVVYLQGELNVSTAGKIRFQFDSPEGIEAWVGDRRFDPRAGNEGVEVEAGRIALTLRVRRSARASGELKVDPVKPSGSSVEFSVVGGK